MDELHVCHLGEIEYREGVALQERIRDAQTREEAEQVLEARITGDLRWPWR